MNAIIMKRGARVLGVAIPNPEGKLSCTIVASKGSQVTEREIQHDFARRPDYFQDYLVTLGVRMGPPKVARGGAHRKSRGR